MYNLHSRAPENDGTLVRLVAMPYLELCKMVPARLGDGRCAPRGGVQAWAHERKEDSLTHRGKDCK